jgi:hypothetical protein
MDEDEELSFPGLSRNQLLLGGAAATVLLLALVITLSRARRQDVPVGENPNIVPGDWEASMKHLAHAWDTRWQLQNDKIGELSNRVTQLVDTLVQVQTVAAPVAQNGNGNAPVAPAAVSMPAPGVPAAGSMPQPDLQAGEALPAPPGPAAVSM